LNSNNSIGDKALCIILFNLRLDTRRSSSSAAVGCCDSDPLSFDQMSGGHRSCNCNCSSSRSCNCGSRTSRPLSSPLLVQKPKTATESYHSELSLGQHVAATEPRQQQHHPFSAPPPMTKPQRLGDAAEINAVQALDSDSDSDSRSHSQFPL